jgi:hypothetical protein
MLYYIKYSWNVLLAQIKTTMYKAHPIYMIFASEAPRKIHGWKKKQYKVENVTSNKLEIFVQKWNLSQHNTEHLGLIKKIPYCVNYVWKQWYWHTHKNDVFQHVLDEGVSI